ncbi:hypothetical protein T492DRAFT_587752 [Pavlovales sp. CCMP2436]|nr:hypothetical protein T492DRAFT_587752 [Pavlovales sp. CCMP2436]
MAGLETRTRTLGLFRQLMRASAGFSNYNFREYALRRVRLGFREHTTVGDSAAALKLVHEGERQLELLRRQATISQLYPQGSHVLEGAVAK